MTNFSRRILVPLILTCCVFIIAGGASAASRHEDEPETTHASTAPIGVKVSTRRAPNGVLVHAVTRGYRWAPEHLSPIHGKGNPIQGEGHGHIYLDGSKVPVLMIVGPWTYLPLEPGRHKIRVTLNANDHNEWTWHGGTVESTTRVMVPAPMVG